MSENINLTIPDEMWEELREKYQLHGENDAEVVRVALRDALRNGESAELERLEGELEMKNEQISELIAALNE